MKKFRDIERKFIKKNDKLEKKSANLVVLFKKKNRLYSPSLNTI